MIAVGCAKNKSAHTVPCANFSPLQFENIHIYIFYMSSAKAFNYISY